MSNFSAFGGLSKEIFANYNNSEFAFLKDNIFLRNIKLNNLEILKMVSFLVRDKNWNNYNPKVLNSEEYKTKNDINFIFDLQYSDKLQKLIVKNKYIISESKLTFLSEGLFESDFWTNRIGFNLLLPLKDVIGKDVVITKESKKIKAKFPVAISPDQPFFKFNKIEYNFNKHYDVIIDFKGIDFEMEDQRNWGDASYKIYSGSLLDPFPYKINKGKKFYQEINIYFDKKNTNIKNLDKKIYKISEHSSLKFKMPKIGIKIKKFDEINLVKNLNFNFFYFIKDFENNKENKIEQNFKKHIYLVALIDHNKDVKSVIAQIYEYINNNKIFLNKLLICPKIYLNSFQPAGEWPNVPNLSKYYMEAKKFFPDKLIVGGMVTNFTELNRKRPEGEFDVINFSLTPIVHDASDIGVMDTPEDVSYILKTLESFSNNKPIHVGPITIGMHHNPYGEKLANNSENQRLEMAEFDPRHDSLLGISWSVAILSQLIGENTKYLTFDSILGHHGILAENNMKRPLYFFNEILVFFENSKVVPLNFSKEIYGLALFKNNKKYFLLTNVTNTIIDANLIEVNKIKQSYLNNKNFNDINENNFTFFNFFETSNNIKFEAYETKLIEVIK